MTRPTVLADGPWAPLPQPRTGPATKTITLGLSEGEAGCLEAIAGRWQWRVEHVAEHLLSEGLACRFLDEQPQPVREVAP